MKKRTIFILMILIGLLVALYFGGEVYFGTHYYPHTKINGIEVGKKTAKDAETLTRKQISGITLTSNQWDEEKKLDSSLFTLKGTVEFKTPLSNPYRWPLEYGKNHEYKAGKIEINEEKLDKDIEELIASNPKKKRKPQNARLKYSSQKKAYEVVGEKDGNQLVESKVRKTIERGLQKITLEGAMSDAETKIDLSDCYEKPELSSTTPKLVECQETLNKWVGSKITYSDDGKTYVVNGDKIHNWVFWKTDYKPYFKESMVREFVEETIAPKFHTVNSVHTFVNHAGKTKAIKGGTFGKVVGPYGETKQLLEDIKNGSKINRAPYYGIGANDEIGNTYVEVSISKQHLWFVKDGKVNMSFDVVTGDPTTGHSTPKGAYFIEFKTINYTMKKYNSFVRRWMPFDTSVGVGLHDADWRGAFGGNIYRGNGSHGCVNCPVSSAKNLYEKVSEGTPVLIVD